MNMDIDLILGDIGDLTLSQLNDKANEGREHLIRKKLQQLEAEGNSEGVGEQIKLLKMELDKIEADSKKEEKPKVFPKRLFISNVKELCRQKKVKLKDIETESGTSIGYTSKLDKPDNPNNPSAEFIAVASKMLDEKVDDLMTRDYRLPQQRLSEGDQYIVDFLNRLIQETMNEDMTWVQETKKELDEIERYPVGDSYEVNHPLLKYMIVNEGTDRSTGVRSVHKGIVYNSMFYEDGMTGINGPGYHAQLKGTEATIYIMNILHSSSKRTNFGSWDTEGQREMYILDADGTLEPLCNTAFSCEEIKELMFKLYDMLRDNYSKRGVMLRSRSVIDGFMSATTSKGV